MDGAQERTRTCKETAMSLQSPQLLAVEPCGSHGPLQ